ncbi:MAG: hypothetical protein AB1631_26695 [Acidobacteriota bacterium]
MPVWTIALSTRLEAFINEMVKSGLYANPEEVVITALERYRDDIAAEMDLVARIDAGKIATSSLQAVLLTTKMQDIRG